MNAVRAGLLFAVLLGAGVLPTRACVTMAEIAARQKAVRLVNESAVIVWDEKARTEHFIQRATFDAAGRSVGFLVPTPDAPKLTEADDGTFYNLEETMEPRVVYKPRKVYKLASIFTYREVHVFNAAGNIMTDDDDSVEVLGTQHVAGYEAAILRARRTDALQKWLKRNRYATPRGLARWLAPYVQRGWVITAFKIRKQDKNQELFSSSLVRMSFHTPRPFFPYSEPQSEDKPKNAGKRSLRVFMFAPTRVQTENGNFSGHREWPGRVKWADNVARNSDYQKSSRTHWIAQDLKLPEGVLRQLPWLTVFEDFSSPRPGTEDVYFKSSQSTQSVLPPPIIKTRAEYVPVYIEYFLLAFGLLFFGSLWFIARKPA
jgi:hypothetical protein